MAPDPIGLKAASGRLAGAAAAAPAGGAADPDQAQVYCRRLGHWLQFSYCRRAETGEPCPRAAECWHDRPEVLAALQGRLPGPAAQPQGKLQSILAIVARVRAAQDTPGEG